MNDKLHIRTAQISDAEELLAIYKPYIENTAITFEYNVPTVEEFANRIKTTLKRYPYIVAELNGKIVGYAYAGVFKGRKAYDWSVETSIYIRLENHGNGIGRKLYEKLEEITKDKQIMRNIQDVYDKFEKYLQVEKRKDVPSISYFSMEYGLSHVLKIYSGGLGILAGDYLKEASDSNIDMTAVGFLYRYGYFTQTLSMDGQQIANYEAQNFNQLPIEQLTEQDGKPMVLEVPYPGRIVYAHIWRVNVGRIKLYLLDTDLDTNSEWDRPHTACAVAGR